MHLISIGYTDTVLFLTIGKAGEVPLPCSIGKLVKLALSNPCQRGSLFCNIYKDNKNIKQEKSDIYHRKVGSQFQYLVVTLSGFKYLDKNLLLTYLNFYIDRYPTYQ
jgi:hypothetical protein